MLGAPCACFAPGTLHTECYSSFSSLAFAFTQPMYLFPGDDQSATIDRTMTPLAVGLRGVATCEVTNDRTAEAFGSGLVPVYATPAMVALLEQAAVHALADSLPPDQTSVGTRIDVSHLAATPLGDTVRAEAVVTAVDGRRLTFLVHAWDSREKIGEGVHERVIVSRDRFLERINAKRPLHK